MLKYIDFLGHTGIIVKCKVGVLMAKICEKYFCLREWSICYKF